VAFASAAQAQPNILFIVTDDQATDTMSVMPNTRSWFEDQGTDYPKAVATTPLCCPSRSSIFTGRYAHNHHVTDNTKAKCLGLSEGPTTGPDPDCGYASAVPNPQRTTLEYYLQQAGYRTGIFGKYLNGWPSDLNPPFFNDWAIHKNTAYTPAQVNEQGVQKWLWEYTPNYDARQARDFLQRAHDENPSQPWFLHLAPETPHEPFVPEPKYADASVPPLPNSASYFEVDRRDKPSWIQQSIGSDTGTVYDEDGLKHDWAEHMKMLRSADDLVEGVMRKLQSLGEDQNTLAFFISDNGYMWGEHGLTTKLRPYLESIQIPFFLRWPGWAGHSGGETSDELVANIDMAPTALQAAGIDPSGLPTQMDGSSLIDPTPQPRNRNLTEGFEAASPAPGVFPSWAAIRTPTFHYIESYETTAQGESVIFREYYDLVNDPSELVNLLADSDTRNDPPTADLSAQLAADRVCGGQTCPSRENAASLFPVDTGITEKPDAVSANKVKFSFSSTEPNSIFRCKLDRNPWRFCNYPSLFSGLRKGKHSLKVRAYAPDGTPDETPATYSWTVDGSPDTRLTGAPPKISTSSNATFTFESPNATAFKCTLDTPTSTGSPQDCSSPKTYTGLADGDYVFTVRAFNASSGQQDPNPQTHSWSIDATSPETQIQPDSNVCPAAMGTTVTCPSTIHGSSLSLALSTSEAPAERFECKLDSAAYTVCSTEKTYTRLGQGTHTVTVRATDLAGNTDQSPATLTWQVGSLQSFATTPDSTWPQIIDGVAVSAIAPDGAGGWYVGGDFTSVGFAGAPGSPHTDLVHINPNHTIDESWNPATGDGEVRALVVSQGNVYVGGTFTSVKGTGDVSFSPRNRLAAFSIGGTPKGQLKTWDPNANGAVSALLDGTKTVAGSTVRTIYAGGGFTTIGSGLNTVPRNRVVELDPTSGQPTSWSPALGGTQVSALAVTPASPLDCAPGSCGYVYAGGSPNLLAEIDRAGTGAVTSWSPNPNGAVNALRYKNGTLGGLPTIFVGGAFTQIGSPQSARRAAAEVNLSDDGSTTSWDPSLGFASGSSSQANAFIPFHCSAIFTGTPSLEPACTTIVGGAFDRMKFGGSPAITRSRIGEADRVTGNPNDWNPNLDNAVLALACFPSTPNANPTDHCQLSGTQMLSGNRILAVGGSFTTVGGTTRKGLAFFSAPPG
jgi:arylsulfatase A-like enzyme